MITWQPTTTSRRRLSKNLIHEQNINVTKVKYLKNLFLPLPYSSCSRKIQFVAKSRSKNIVDEVIEVQVVWILNQLHQRSTVLLSFVHRHVVVIGVAIDSKIIR
jgi:hypothetical protein